MSKILIAIDGTGPFFNDEYSKEMDYSFVHSIYLNSGISRKFYHRGPSLTGAESGIIGIRGLLDYLAGLRSADKSEIVEVFITGYSRGAMITVYLANRIHEFNLLNKLGERATSLVKRSFGFATESPAEIKIKSMMLFDAVSSDATMYGPGIRVIPPCVEEVYHFVCRESSTALPRSRWYFNRIRLDIDSRYTRSEILSFGCTHAAIGGLPGQGDHRLPTTRAGVAAAALGELAKPTIIAHPALTAAKALGVAALKAYDSVRSNVTLEEDFAIYKSVRAAAFQRLQPNWMVSKLPAYGSLTS
ncbi:hypothetical protein [Terrarubrum flagellatum]|uniref:hypothetical protein n=1 Tax=Terrirubrum flagellatum TaxID=2895980 RepID=UPI003144D5FA